MAKRGSDSRKQVWKFQEGAVVLALRQVLGAKTEIHWDHTPKGMSIDPDVVIGKDPDRPEVVVFVTHASAEMVGQKKLWRTVAEAIEAKRLPSHPKILSVLFPGNVKGALKEIYKTLFDGCLHLDEVPYGKGLDEALSQLTREHGIKAKDACLAILKTAVSEKRIPSFGDFTKSVKSLLKAKYGSKHEVMASSAFSGAGRVPKARFTSLRRSVCKLYTLPPDLREALLTGKPFETVPPHALLLEWFTEGVTGEPELMDDELRAFLATAKKEEVAFLCNYADDNLPSFRQYAQSLRDVGNSRYVNEWILKHYGDLSTQNGMAKHLRAVFVDPAEPLAKVAGHPVPAQNHWLFQALMAVLRTETGRSDGYGYSELAKDAKTVQGVSAANFSITDFVGRKKLLPVKLLNPISNALAKHVRRLGPRGLDRLLNTSLQVKCKHIFNFQMMNYKLFNPIEWLILDSAKDGIDEDIKWPAVHDSFLGTDTGGPAASSGNLVCIRAGRIWVKCQSAYDGRIDKRKELCGRIGAMKLTYAAGDLVQKRFYLVLDGAFDAADLKLLAQAGWDGVFYFDETDALVTVVSDHLSKKKGKRKIALDAEADLPLAAEDDPEVG